MKIRVAYQCYTSEYRQNSAAKQQISWVVSLWQSPLTFVWPGAPKQHTTTAPSSQSERHLMVFCINEMVPDYVVYLVSERSYKTRFSADQYKDPTYLDYLDHYVFLVFLSCYWTSGLTSLSHVLPCNTYALDSTSQEAFLSSSIFFPYIILMTSMVDITEPSLRFWSQAEGQIFFPKKCQYFEAMYNFDHKISDWL